MALKLETRKSTGTLEQSLSYQNYSERIVLKDFPYGPKEAPCGPKDIHKQYPYLNQVRELIDARKKEN